MTIHPRLLRLTDRLLASQILLVVVGTALAFGGAVWWWMKPALAALTAGLAMTALIRPG